MSSVAASGLIGPNSGLIPSQVMRSNLENSDETFIQRDLTKPQEYESETESDTSTDDDDTSDDDKRLANNPVLKERLKQLDRYATPIKHHAHSPVQMSDKHTLSGLFATNMPVSNHTPHSGPVSIHGKPIGSSEVIDSSSTPPDYHFHQLSVSESPTSCSGPASLNTSVTPSHNLSPPYTISGTNTSIVGPMHQHKTDLSDTYFRLSNTLPPKSNELPPGYKYGLSFNSPDVMHSNDIFTEKIGTNQDCVCKVCHIVCPNRSSLRNHMKKHINHSVKRHQCDHCPYSTQYGRNLIKHIDSMHAVANSQEFRCEGCSRCFSNETLLRDHDCIMAQCNTYRCNECGRVFKTKLRLKYHSDVHNPRKPYVCDIEGCDRAFRTPKYLKNHRDEFHRIHPKNYSCPVEQCDLVFHRKTHLKRHIATHDDSEKKYQCQWPNCQRRFCSEETLNLHYRKHTGEKPFSCALCLYNCYDRPSLNEHYQIHHVKDGNIDCDFKDIHHQMPSSCSSQRPPETLGYRGPCTAGDLVTRTSTPVPTLRHRMADILDSCAPQVPGPLDAEISGILDSLDKESDLPDLFGNAGFDTDRSITEKKFIDNSNQSLNSRTLPYRQNNQPSCVTTLPSVSSSNVITTESGTNESSLNLVLLNILSELQRAESSGSAEEFEKAKSHVLSVLPTFVIGEKLTAQISEIVDEVNDALVAQPLHVVRAAFHTARPFTREESYMIGLLEQQISSESSLIAPNPPRRRGRRPKLQQQLQPYLQRIFCLESGAAESMASQLVNTSQKDKRTNYYGHYRSLGFRRGRISRSRGRSSKHFQLGMIVPHDESVPRTSHFNHSQYRPSGIDISCGSIARKHQGSGRYHIESISDNIHTNFSNEISSQRNLMDQYNAHSELIDNLKRPNGFHAIHSQLQPEDFNYSTERFRFPQEENLLKLSTKSRSSDGEFDDGENSDILARRYMHNQNKSDSAYKDHRIRDHLMRESNSESEQNARRHDSHGVKRFLDQETLGEMLEDIGVIVQRIGETAVARKHQNYLDGQPLNLSDFAHGEQFSGSINSLPIHNKNGNNAQSTQLPSMVTLTSGSVSTPPSVEESTPGCVSNVEPQVLSPHLSTASLHAPSSLKSSHPYNQSSTPMSDTDNLISGKPSTITLNTSHKSEQMTYNSASNNYHRVAPMWSCESMCCPLTRDDEVNKVEEPCPGNDYSSQVGQTRIPQSAGNYSKELNGDINQCFYPKDLSTRVLFFEAGSDSTHHSSTPPTAFTKPDPSDPVFSGSRYDNLVSRPIHLSSKASAMGSLISAAEAVDHLRSLSALGAKYTASVGAPKEGQYQHYQHLRPGDYSYNYTHVHSNGLPRNDPSEHSESTNSYLSRNSALIPTQNAFRANMPSLNNLLYRSRKSDEYLNSLSGVTGSESNHDNSVNICSISATNTNINAQNDVESLSAIRSTGFGNYINSSAFGNLNNYSSAAAAAAYHQLSRCNTSSNNNNADNQPELIGRHNYTNNPTSSSSSSLTHSFITSCASPSISVRSSLQELYQNQHHHQHHNQQQQQSSVRQPVQELTTRRLLSEAAATAYAHGLGRCDSQTIGGLSVSSMLQDAHSENLRNNQFNPTGSSCTQNQFRHQTTGNNQYNTQLSVPSNNRLLNEYMFSTNNNSTSEYSNTNYTEHNPGATNVLDSNTHPFYSSHLHQTTNIMHNALSKSIEQSQSNSASQLVHSINEVSNLAAAEAAAAAAYAYHQYQQQAQVINRQHSIISQQPPSTYLNYQNLFNQTNRSYSHHSGQLDEQLSQRGDLTLYNNTTHSERHDPKAAYLAETYRNAQITPGRFLF
ncbi:unnamed protein product [Schistosoma rodhaini]|nr:unnamed protein product [Schistosoma rodhaini]